MSTRTTEEILQDMMSRDYSRLRTSVWEIISLFQERERILPFVPYLQEIRDAMKDAPKIEREWEYEHVIKSLYGDKIPVAVAARTATNVKVEYPYDFVIRVIEFHKNNVECPCALYEAMGENYGYNKIPDEVEKGYVKILETVMGENKQFNTRFVDYYIVECTRCKQKFKVIEREYHAPWWGWTRVE